MADSRKTRVSDLKTGKYAEVVAQAAAERGVRFDTSRARGTRPAIRRRPMSSDARS